MSQYQTTQQVYGLREPPLSAPHPEDRAVGPTPNTIHFFDEQYQRDAEIWEPDVQIASAAYPELARYLRQEFAGPHRSQPVSGGSAALMAQFPTVEEWNFPRENTLYSLWPDEGWEPWRRPIEEGAVRLNERPIEVTMEAGLS
jgi:hypothetical protein